MAVKARNQKSQQESALLRHIKRTARLIRVSWARRRTETLMVAIGPFALVYTIVYPALVASGSADTEDLHPAIAGWMFLTCYLGVWTIAVGTAFLSALVLYKSHKTRSSRLRAGIVAIISTTLSYIITIYGFAVAFLFISHRNPGAFSPGELDLFTCIYFSVITAATVGYGDIHPISATARLLTITEIAVNLMYVIFLFSVIAGFLQSAIQSSQPEPTLGGEGPRP